MTVTTTYPGVYITEIPSGSRTIVGVATSITAFLGGALRGPVDEPVPIASFADFERTFGGLTRSSGMGYAVRDFYLNGGGEAVVVRLVHIDADDEEASAAVAQVPLSAAPDTEGLTLEASSPGAWGNALQVEVSHPDPLDPDAIDVANGQGVTVDDLFSLTIREGDPDAGGAAETFLNVTTVDGPRQVDVVLGGSQLVRVIGALPATRPDPRPDPADPTPYTVDADAQGADGAVANAADYEGSADEKTGIHALLKADLFNILCIPPPTPESDLPAALWAVAADFCFRQRAFLIVDAPMMVGTTPEPATVFNLPTWVTGDGGLTGASMRNAAVYFPRIRRPDPLRGGATADFAACGAIAGTYARTDGSRGVWKAPAGIEAGLAGVVGLAVALTDADNGRLNPKGVNCLRTFRGIGSVVWGARTLRGNDVLADEYKYVPVRRLALFLEESLYRNTQWVVFEPNDEPMWSQVRLSIGAFMQDLFRRGAFQGSSPRDAFFVRCDGDTTTQYHIDRGIVNILIGFAPLKPAEFVVIALQQKTASAGA